MNHPSPCANIRIVRKFTRSAYIVNSNGGLREQVRGALANQSARTVTGLSSLLAIEDEIGYIPTEAIEEVATFTNSTVNDVWGVASFYTNFRFTPPNEHVVEVCWGPTCHLLGAMELLQSVLQSLGLSEEGDTPDGKISLKYNTCLGACSQGPVVRIDDKILGPQALADAKEAPMSQSISSMMSNLRNGG